MELKGSLSIKQKYLSKFNYFIFILDVIVIWVKYEMKLISLINDLNYDLRILKAF